MKGWLSCIVLAISGATGWVFGSNEHLPDRILVLSVGQGDCAVVESGGRVALIDVGPFEPRGGLVGHLGRLGINSVDLILLSHPDADHVGDLAEVHRAFPGAAVVAPIGFRSDAKLAKTLASAGVTEVAWLSQADGSLGRFHLEIRCPNYHPGEADNRGSMFVRVWEGEASFVTTGDAPAETEALEARADDWRSEVLHVGHHGSRTSTSLAWLGLVHPRLAVISCGKNNRYGHPNPEVLERLAGAGAKVYRTDTMGDIELDVAQGEFRPKT
jgi:competence protein ComEC